MGYDLFVTGDDITADRLNNLERSAVIQASTSDYPTDPNKWMTASESNGRSLVQWTTTTTGWQLPWSLPWGAPVGSSAGNAAVFGGIAGETVVVSANGFECPLNRLIHVVCNATYVGHSAGTVSPRFSIYLQVDAGTPVVLRTTLDDGITPEFQLTKDCSVTYGTIADGVHTFYLVAHAEGGSSIDVRGDLALTQISVFDMGPNGAPET